MGRSMPHSELVASPGCGAMRCPPAPLTSPSMGTTKSLFPLSDGRILATGWSWSGVGLFHRSVIRLLPDGKPDPSFGSGTGIELLPDDFPSLVIGTSGGGVLLAGDAQGAYLAVGRLLS